MFVNLCVLDVFWVLNIVVYSIGFLFIFLILNFVLKGVGEFIVSCVICNKIFILNGIIDWEMGLFINFFIVLDFVGVIVNVCVDLWGL